MTTTTVTRHAAISLHTPFHRRWLAVGAALADRLREAAEAAAERRRAREHYAALSHLDQRTLRDIGLGDWGAAARDADAAAFRRTLDLHAF